MLCPSCKAVQPDGSAHCSSCGCNLRVAFVPPKKVPWLPIAGAIGAALIALVIWLATRGPDHKARTPEDAVRMPLKALRENDLNTLFATIQDSEQEKARTTWSGFQQTRDPVGDGRYNQAMAMMLAPGAIDSLMDLIEPGLEQVDGDAMVEQIQNAVAKAGSAGEDEEVQNKIVEWAIDADFTNPDKVREALGHVIASAQAFDVRTADQLRALSFDQMLSRIGKALPELKQALAVYDCDVDRLLDSVRIGSGSGSGAARSVEVTVSIFGKDQTVPARVFERDGRWFPEEQKKPVRKRAPVTVSEE